MAQPSTKEDLFQKNMDEYRKQLEKGAIREAYKGLMDYIMSLKMYFQKNHPDFSPSNGIYFGYMDMTYFPLFPKSLKDRKMKIAIVFIHSDFRFEVWLSGSNKQIQTKYLKLFRGKKWTKYNVPFTTKGVDSILEYILVYNPDFSKLDALTNQIEKGTLEFIRDVENFLNENSN